ncbi:hypothetical protein H0G86_012252 [Trichoderma simmonsii]|uniref:Uncharacterized protein n=1 Tax=Trichoderma simmonsii TaxID=1491479 RepID=A0A8G0LR18_9HYPO|nr:hypothetical protein H0G86_012252 [Trichoderma simmonsii]
MPGELFCRWRDKDGVLCDRYEPYFWRDSLRYHYRYIHALDVPINGIKGFTAGYHDQLDRWYTEVANGEDPNWIPINPADSTYDSAIKNADGTMTLTPKKKISKQKASKQKTSKQKISKRKPAKRGNPKRKTRKQEQS